MATSTNPPANQPVTSVANSVPDPATGQPHTKAHHQPADETPTPSPWTDAAYMALPSDGHRYELVDGEVIDRGNLGMEHGDIGAFLAGCLAVFVRQHRLGSVCDSSTAFTLKSGNKRSPGVSFIDGARLQGLKRPPKGFFEGAPDLAVEILSPSITVGEMSTKLSEYFENGTRFAWVIYPDEKFVLVYDTPQPKG